MQFAFGLYIRTFAAAVLIAATTLMLHVCPPAASAFSNSREYFIDDVIIEGNRLVSTEEISRVIKTRKGDKYDRDVVLQDLRAIHELGCFDEESLAVNPTLTPRGVLLKICVKENPTVQQFIVSGNDSIASEQITKIFSNQLFKPQNFNNLVSAIDQVECVYQEKGFVLARVVDVKDGPDGSIELVINEGILENIVFVGNVNLSHACLKAMLKLEPVGAIKEFPYNNNAKARAAARLNRFESETFPVLKLLMPHSRIVK